jgi:CRP/FNR family cyclic AMP-dependent transcriptional regulator
MSRQLEEILAEHPFFEGLGIEQVRLVAGCAKSVHFREGEYIFREGGIADQFYLIRSGKVSLELYSPRRGPLMVQTLGVGTILGWDWLIPPFKWSIDARAIESVDVTVLDGRCLREKSEQDCTFGYELMKRITTVIGGWLSSTRIQLLDLYCEKEGRVA